MGGVTCLLLLLWAGVTVSTVLDLQKRIIGGRQCERQYHVKLRFVDGVCGGSLISDRWILTAAHCWEPGKVFADLSVNPRGPAQEMQITGEPVIFTDKDNNNKMRSHDIMLLQLPSPSNAPPVALPDCNVRPKKFEIAGHGATTGGPNNERIPNESPTLHCADIDVVNCADLKNTFQKDFPNFYQVKKYQHWFCGQTPGIDICYGDSGGGVVYKDKIYGVISSSGDTQHVCRKAAAFMDLCNPEYAAWIKKNIT